MYPTRFPILALAGIALTIWSPCGFGFDLVTSDEFRHEQGYVQAHADEIEAIPAKSRTRGSHPANGPTIQVLAPADLQQPITPPVRIQLKFDPSPGGEIMADTFRVLYGFLGLDITERILKHVVLDKNGITIDKAEVPPGRHTLKLIVSDNQGRKAERQITFVVNGPD